MSTTDNDRLNSSTEQAATSDVSGVSRRKFLGGLGGAAAAAVASGVIGLEPLANAATGSAATEAAVKAVTPSDIRRKAAWQMRKNMGDYWWSQGNVVHATNGDEQRCNSQGEPDRPRDHRRQPDHRHREQRSSWRVRCVNLPDIRADDGVTTASGVER